MGSSAETATAPTSRKRPRATIHLFEPYCKGCGVCVEMCPHDVFVIGDRLGPAGYFVADVVHADACTACMLCEIACPDLAITVIKE